MLNVLCVVAQTSGPEQTGASPFTGLLPMMILLGAVIYFVMIRPQSKERKQREQMLSALKKNDRVVTIGGILGTVVSVKDDEVTLKVDESNNTKIPFLRSAIQRVLKSESPSEQPPAKQ
jgi:preprotein translocase subunit YajC